MPHICLLWNSNLQHRKMKACWGNLSSTCSSKSLNPFTELTVLLARQKCRTVCAQWNKWTLHLRDHICNATISQCVQVYSCRPIKIPISHDPPLPSCCKKCSVPQPWQLVVYLLHLLSWSPEPHKHLLCHVSCPVQIALSWWLIWALGFWIDQTLRIKKRLGNYHYRQEFT